jgi:glycosyltransferase involved in cell wall biosynthesis
MVAFHYPPCALSSGVHRTLKFTRYLPDCGWQPVVLTAHARVYARTADAQLQEIPPDVSVWRAYALDAARDLSLRGRYPRWAALPDRWVSWWLHAVPAGLRAIARHRPKVIWSTYPVATAHLVGLSLHRLTGLPWVADFRDPMTEDDYPTDRLRRSVHGWIERRAAKHAAHLVFTTESALGLYRARYPELGEERCVLIPNGYDEQDFEGLAPRARTGTSAGPVRLLHAGLIYPEERDPRPLLRSVSRLKESGRLSARALEIRLRGAGSEPYFTRLCRELGIDDVVRLLPPVGYRDALQECVDADALLLLQGDWCNRQVPAKAYEYLRARRPILALTDERGDTAKLLRTDGGATIVSLADEDAITEALPGFLNRVRDGSHPLPDMARVATHARAQQARDLARLLFQAVTRPPAGAGVERIVAGGRCLESVLVEAPGGRAVVRGQGAR